MRFYKFNIRALISIIWIICIFVTFFFFLFTDLVIGQSVDEFAARRKELIKQISSNCYVVLVSPPEKVRNEDVNYEYRQSSNFYYLTGFTEPHSMLILAHDKKILVEYKGASTGEILFVSPKNKNLETWTGIVMGPEKAKNELQFQETLTNDRFESVFSWVLQNADTVYLDYSEIDLNDPLPMELEIVKRARDRLYPVTLKKLRPLLSRMREIKSPTELAKMRKAIEITSAAILAVMEKARPNMYEYELEALIEYTYRRNGSERVGFPSIVGSGPNNCILHYEKNDRLIQPGELVLMDIGAEFGMYTADITRTIPISGKFSERQREVYNHVLKIQEEAISIIKPGIPFDSVNSKAVEIAKEGMIELGLINNKSEYEKYFLHRVSHHVGLDVHDPSASDSLRAGMVITVEPGIYIPEENFGIRIEDDVLVTENGYEVLSSAVPKTVEKIESIMQRSQKEKD